MKTQIIAISGNQIDPAWRETAGDCIKQGGLVAFPTETVYGLGGDALNKDSSRKIYEAKGRPSDNPLIVHIADWEMLKPLVQELPKAARLLGDAFWPGPLTMVLKKSELVPYETTGGLDTVAVRMPSHKEALEFIQSAGGYVAAPSANLSGRPSPSKAEHVIEDLSGRIDIILDGGEVDIGLESTIVDLTVNPPQILRPGYVTEEMLSSVIGSIAWDPAILSADSKTPPRAPGMKYRHYAPKAPLTIVEGADVSQVAEYINDRIREASSQQYTVGIIATEETQGLYGEACIKCIGSRSREDSIAKHLYAILREFDEEKVDVIYSEGFSQDGLGQAIMNRLLKAAGHQIIHI